MSYLTGEFRSDSPEQTRRLAAMLARGLRAGDVVALEGELGAGKTCFVRGLAEGLGLNTAQVTSPTFVLSHEYEPADTSRGGMTLVHIDAYRLRSGEDLDAIGWQELMDRRDAIIALEWPSRVSSALPADRIKVQIEHSGDTSRVLTVTIPPAKADRLQHLDMDRQPRPTDPQVVACRSCGRSFDRSANTFPFCSERCRLADLGQWFREGYRTSRALERDEELNE